jgi:hypothetical protein
MMMKSAASSFIQLSVILGLTLGIHAQEGMYLAWLADPRVTRPSESKLFRTPWQTTRSACTFLTLSELLYRTLSPYLQVRLS